MIDQLSHEPRLGGVFANLGGVLLVGLCEGARGDGESDDQCETHDAKYVIGLWRFQRTAYTNLRIVWSRMVQRNRVFTTETQRGDGGGPRVCL